MARLGCGHRDSSPGKAATNGGAELMNGDGRWRRLWRAEIDWSDRQCAVDDGGGVAG